MKKKLRVHPGVRVRLAITGLGPSFSLIAAIDQLIPLANEKLRKRLFVEASLSIRQLNVEAGPGGNEEVQTGKTNTGGNGEVQMGKANTSGNEEVQTSNANASGSGELQTGRADTKTH